MLAWAMPSVSNLVDRQLSPCDGGVLVHTLIICLYVLKNILSSSNPLGFQPLPLYFTFVKHMGRKGYPVRDGLFFLPITPRRVVSFSSSARRDRGGVALRRRGYCTYSHYTSLCFKKYSVFFQPPRLTATPPIFYIRKTHGEKRLPCA